MKKGAYQSLSRQENDSIELLSDRRLYGSIDGTYASTASGNMPAQVPGVALSNTAVTNPILKLSVNSSKNVAFEDDFSSVPLGNAEMKTGRQRKKWAARGRGGEFMSKENKTKIYFCCVAATIDLEALTDNFSTENHGLIATPHSEVVHLHKPIDPTSMTPDILTSTAIISRQETLESETAQSPRPHDGSNINSMLKPRDEYSVVPFKLTDKEIFVFNFGAVVFWGFTRSEAFPILQTIKKFGEKHVIKEFSATEDDIFYIFSDNEQPYSIANDVIVLPTTVSIKDRISLSFAIAQSSVLALFEARIEKTVSEHKYIPETLASSGKIRLSAKQLGVMIGNVYVIQHSVNLHSEILDIPDMFWREDESTMIYKTAKSYFEIDTRTDVLNTRLNMLKDLLRVLQQQHESAHNVKLEWIVIWLIVASVGVELCAMIAQIWR